MITVILVVAAFVAGAVAQAVGLFGWLAGLVSRRMNKVQ